MNGKRNHGIVFGAVIAALLVLVAPVALSAATIRIGAILPITGNSALNGQSVRDGIQLAVDEVNARGGVNGSRIEILLEDSKSDPVAAVEAFNRLEASRKPLFYISSHSAVGVVLAPLADQKQVVLVGLITPVLEFTRDREWVYRYWPLGQDFILPIMRILQDLKVRKLGILFQNDAYGKEQQELATNGFSGAGKSVVARLLEMNDTDFRTPIAGLKEQDAVYVACSGRMLTDTIAQLKQAGYRGYIVAAPGAANPALFAMPEMEGVYLAAPIIHNPNYLYAREAGEAFTARFKKPFEMWAANGYDFLKLFATLLEDHKPTRQVVKDLLAGGFQYSGVFGHVSLRAGERDLSFPWYPAQITGGTLKYR